MSNVIRAKVSIKGTRALIQHAFTAEAIPLQKQEKTGVAGNDPQEWKRSCLLSEDRRLYLPPNYIFGCLKNGAIHTKKGRGSLQAPLVSTLSVEDEIVHLNRKAPPESELTHSNILAPADPSVMVFIFVSTVRNPATKGRNVRYRLATRAGWKCSFTISWDKTIIARPQMEAIVNDSGRLGGLGDGLRIGAGRFEVTAYEVLGEDSTSSNGAEKRKKVTA